MATDDEARAARDAKLDALHERLTDAVEALVSGDDWRQALEFAARFRARSFRNTLLILAQHEEAFEQGRVPGPEPSYVAGYKQWQALGRQVAKGQPGYMIFAPVTGRFASSTPQDAGSWRRLERFEKPKPGEVVRSRMVGAKPAYVWDVSQTTGDPIPERPRVAPLGGEAPEGLWEGLTALIEAEGFAVARVPDADAIQGADGLTHYGTRIVSVREDISPAEQVETLVHELAHVRMHGPDNADAARHRGIREVEAESVALMVAAAHGMDAAAPSALYVSEWASSVKDKSPVEVVQETGERVRKVAGTILDALPTVQVGSGDPPGLTREARAQEHPARAVAPVAERPRASHQAERLTRSL
ncbi:ImmA/IrrE family metallo-endopeptidase [Rhodococcus ruber]|uniref:ArdC-like ssDNA-binding domain-containing protein n=1 Tax=Rhodococcus ruber TaxID=1830 RepID=UPI00177D0BC5|nr:ArdC-like ssDNA-binding domain-containing protein [Rhodococcus ruber]MBD8053571.1 ImmA/IrrE family metallo-endopeptidase [Rhodococcus ruber]